MQPRFLCCTICLTVTEKVVVDGRIVGAFLDGIDAVEVQLLDALRNCLALLASAHCCHGERSASRRPGDESLNVAKAIRKAVGKVSKMGVR